MSTVALAHYVDAAEDVAPLEITVMFARPLGMPSYMVCGLDDEGRPEVMFQGEFHKTEGEARASAWEFAKRIIARGGGMNVWYRSDLES